MIAALEDSGIRILGLYKVPQGLTIWKGSPLEDWASKLLDELWLLEVSITKLEREFDDLDITQEDPNKPEKRWQCAYDPTFLDPAGMMKSKHVVGDPARVIFFFHYLKLDKPLLIQSREYLLPKPSPLPRRLEGLVMYDIP